VKTPRETKCDYCHVSSEFLKRCRRCRKYFCLYHIGLAEHNCKGVDWEEVRRKEQERMEKELEGYKRSRNIELLLDATVPVIAVVLLSFLLFLFLYNQPQPEELPQILLDENKTFQNETVIKNDIELVIQNETEIEISFQEKLTASPKNSTFFYVLRGETWIIRYATYGGLNSYLASLSRYYYCYDVCPTDEEIVLRFVNEPTEREFILPLVEDIRSRADNSDDQVRIAVSMVQHIPYDYEGFETDTLTNRYPYEVLYDNKGVCGEKSHLLAFILKELGYGVVLFDFEEESHMAVGIRCPKKYSYITFTNNSYCFIETAQPAIITEYKNEYVGVGQLTSTPDIYLVSDGNSFDSVEEEYLDAMSWRALSGSEVLPEQYYYRWLKLKDKYGLIIDYG